MKRTYLKKFNTDWTKTVLDDGTVEIEPTDLVGNAEWLITKGPFGARWAIIKHYSPNKRDPGNVHIEESRKHTTPQSAMLAVAMRVGGGC